MAASPPVPQRLPLIDAARGTAILAMIAYHACWDLNMLGLLRVDLFSSPFWLGARTAILGSFLLLSGVSLVLAAEGGLGRPHFRRRLLRRFLLLAAAAGVVSATSYWAFPQSPIFFGVLHHIAAASLLALLFLRLPWPVTLLLGIAVIVAGRTLSDPLFDHPWLRWVGLMTFEPTSNDYVPLFPWFGAVLLGIAIGRLWRRPPLTAGAAWRPEGRAAHGLVRAGRHSLAVYLIHQPLLLAVFWLVAQGVGAPPPEVRDFLDSCRASCVESGAKPNSCAEDCRCVSDSVIEQGLWSKLLAGRLDPAERDRVDIIAQRCMRPVP